MDSLDKKYYKIREVSDMLNLPASTLRFWEKEFSCVVTPRRNEHKTRFYTPSDVEAFQMIQYLLKDKGMKIDAAREQLSRNRAGVSRRAKVLDSLRNVRSQLQGLLDGLNSMK